jgi:GNAT superfamily N-acetyltransferase
MPSIAVRPATPHDIPLIRSLIGELAAYEKEPAAAIATDAQLADAHFGPRAIAESLIGEVDGQAQGFALFFHNFSTWTGRRGIHLEDLFVRPSARGAGLGKALFIEVARVAHQRGCARLEWAVLDWNTPAIEFYKRLGAKAMDEWTTFRLGEQALLPNLSQSSGRGGRVFEAGEGSSSGV